MDENDQRSSGVYQPGVDSVGPNSSIKNQQLIQRPSTRESSLVPNMIDEHQVAISTRSQPSYMAGDLNMSTNTCFYLACIFLLNIPGFLIDYGQSYQNQLNPCFKAKYGWDKGYDQDIHIAILGGSVIFGMLFGAMIGGPIMWIGRRRCMFFCIFIGVSGNFISINLQYFWMVITGRFLYGFAVGMYQSIVPRMIEEMVPQHLFSVTMASFSFAKHSSSMVNFQLAVILPPDTDTQGLKDTHLWLVWYVYIPVGLSIIFLFSMIFVFRFEPTKFLIQEGRTEEAIKAVRNMYKYAKDDATALIYIDKIKSMSGKGTSSLTLKDAMFNPRYRGATWFSFVYVCFHELAGNSLINLYSNQIFKDMQSRGNAFMTPRNGVIVVGWVAFVSSLFSTQLVRCFGRKTLLLWGHGAIALLHAGVAISNIENFDEGVVFSTMGFILAYQLTSGPITYIYATETTIDAASGIIMPALFGTIFVISIVSPIIIDPNVLGPTGTFWILCGISAAAFVFVAIFMKETYGLQDREKKMLFTPKKFIEEKDEALMD